jgi:hypothetical protein
MAPYWRRFSQCSISVWGYGIAGDFLACLAAAFIAILAGGSGLAIGIACSLAVIVVTGINFIRYQLKCSRPLREAKRECYRLYLCPLMIPSSPI